MKKQPPQISEDKILQASWELLQDEGMEKFSMRRLADRLGIAAPSIYWHFKSKMSLYQRMANEISRTILTEYEREGGWREQLAGLVAVVRNVLTRYPCSTQLMMMTLPHEPDYIRLTNALLSTVEHTPLRQEQRFQAILTVMNYVFNFVLDDYLHRQNVAALEQSETGMPREEMSKLLDKMSEEEAGLVRGIFSSGLSELMGSDSAFEFGLNLILTGMEQVMEQQRRNDLDDGANRG